MFTTLDTETHAQNQQKMAWSELRDGNVLQPQKVATWE
jgi:hypothetical protein